MRCIITTVSGNTYVSRHISLEEVLESLPEDGYAGKLPSGTDIYIRSVDDVKNFFHEAFKFRSDLNSQYAEMEMEDGRTIRFNVRHVESFIFEE